MLCWASVPLSRSALLLSDSNCFCISGVSASRNIFWMSFMRFAIAVSSAFAPLRRSSSAFAFWRSESMRALISC